MEGKKMTLEERAERKVAAAYEVTREDSQDKHFLDFQLAGLKEYWEREAIVHYYAETSNKTMRRKLEAMLDDIDDEYSRTGEDKERIAELKRRHPNYFM